MKMNSRPLLFAFAAAVLMFTAHRALKAQHHRHCTGDLLRVVLFSQSTMCTHTANVLRVVELAWDQAVKMAMSHVLDLLTSVLKGVPPSGATTAGAGLWFPPQLFS